MTAVADTNVVAALMLPTAASADVAELLRQDPDWRVPPLWRSEFRHVLLKYVRTELATPAQALALWQKALERFELNEHPVDGHQVLDLAIRSGCSTYDAEFVVLAQQLNCSLLTFDRKLLQLFPDRARQPAG
ncbi:type II toxin-antitoxin system VapC family toxin [Vulcanococcus limneticus Candia 3F8]|uniref:type II toxin-antitoxin system VapC family toxin n=1 Tax=Vulcanococcus limneticus TaxID=2170428 RepID=UPI000B980FDB|nr:type II toxin-antitoxin system VapC family toxin [Vulcanococcus limneticus]MCP9894947.1 type II toxin-antitoxin system VapC family toxin [Vulcanococcus limneticus Candia 3F8]